MRMGGYNCTILASLVEVDGWLNIHAFLLFISNICSYYLLSCPFYFSHFNSLFTILVLFNLRMGGYNKLYDPGAYCIKLLPEKNSGYFNRSFLSYGKVNGKIMLTRVFRFYLSFSPVKVLCNGPLVSLVEVDGWLNIHAFLL